MSLAQFAEALESHKDFGKTFVHKHFIPPRPAVTGNLPPLPESLTAVMKQLGIHALYSHQTEAIRHLQEGKNLLLATETASGKTLVYTLAVMEKILENPNTRALFLFPLKALEHDQLKNLSKWLAHLKPNVISAAVYDGDTSPYQRKKIRQHPPNILFSNPDMLHRSILAYHHGWENLFQKPEICYFG